MVVGNVSSWFITFLYSKNRLKTSKNQCFFFSSPSPLEGSLRILIGATAGHGTARPADDVGHTFPIDHLLASMRNSASGRNPVAYVVGYQFGNFWQITGNICNKYPGICFCVWVGFHQTYILGMIEHQPPQDSDLYLDTYIHQSTARSIVNTDIYGRCQDGKHTKNIQKTAISELDVLWIEHDRLDHTHAFILYMQSIQCMLCC